MGTLHPPEGRPHRYAQLYIMDPAKATAQQQQLPANRGCNPDLMRQLVHLMHQSNLFVRAYRMLYEVEQEVQKNAAEHGLEMPQITMAFKHDCNQDPGQYNNPRVTEVAVIFENNDEEPPYNRDILVHLRANDNIATRRFEINLLDINLDAFSYPLLVSRTVQ